MGHFLQITIARKTLPFLKKSYTISCDREMKKWATFCKLRSQEKLYHFSRKTIEFLVITKSRNGPLSANYDRKKNYKIVQLRLILFEVQKQFENHSQCGKPRYFSVTMLTCAMHIFLGFSAD